MDPSSRENRAQRLTLSQKTQCSKEAMFQLARSSVLVLMRTFYPRSEVQTQRWILVSNKPRWSLNRSCVAYNCPLHSPTKSPITRLTQCMLGQTPRLQSTITLASTGRRSISETIKIRLLKTPQDGVKVCTCQRHSAKKSSHQDNCSI